MKKTLGLLTCACVLAISHLSVLVAHAQVTGTVTITGYTGPGGTVEIPTNLNGLTVTAVGEGAFRAKTTVTSVLIPGSVTNIGNEAFALCTGLTNVTMSHGVTSIGDYAFKSCTSLKDITIPDTVERIGWAAFESSGVTTITVDLLNSSYSSRDGVLFNKSQTQLIQYPPGRTGAYTVPDSVTNIGNDAFYRCANLTSVTIGDGTTAIESWAFYGCTGLTNVSIGDSVISIGGWAFCGCTNLSRLTIGNNVVSIGDNAFERCFSLAAITIPDSVTQIGDGAFSYCSLTNINIPQSVRSIGVMAFYSPALSAFTVASLNPAYSSANGVLFNKAKTTLLQCPATKSGVYAVPLGVTNIGVAAFSRCAKLGKVTIPNSVRTIGDSAFLSCSSLTNITIPTSVTSIGDGAFGGCGRLTKIDIPNGVLTIGASAFSSCSSLTNISIPSSVTNIGDDAFAYCHSLSNILVAPLNSHYSSREGALFNKDQTVLIICPSGKTGSFTVPGSVTHIGERAFAACSLSEVTLGKNVNSIGDAAFEGARLTAIHVDPLNSSYSSVDGVLFNRNQTILIQYPGGRDGTYAVPEGVTSIGNAAFSSCSWLEGITIPGSVLSIGDRAFENCWFLTDVAIGPNVGKIGDYAFAACGSLTSVMIPKSVASMGVGVFSHCRGLTGLYFEGNAPRIDAPQFYYENDNNGTAFYLPGTTGWGATFDGHPTAPWMLPSPVILGSNGSFGVQNNAFGFTVSGATNASVVVEACTNLDNPEWIPVSTNVLTGGRSDFSDPRWATEPARFYRLRSL